MPKINHFTPKYGPLSGNTSVSIDGNSWGEPEIYNISATIAGVNCQIKAYHISSITCITGSVDKEISGNYLKFSVSNENNSNSILKIRSHRN
jgi:hypothetical protein